MSRVQIENLFRARRDDPRLWGNFVDFPTPGGQIDVYSIPIQGWVIGRAARAVDVEITHDGQSLLSIPVNHSRPDVAAIFPQVEVAATCGFMSSVSVVGLPSEFELRLWAVLDDGSRVQLAVIQARRVALRLPAAQRPKLRPLLVTTLGRTGSSWLMQLLAQHPEIVAYRPFSYEPRLAGCWATLFRTLAAPQAYRNPLAPDLSNPEWWLGRTNPSAKPRIREPEIDHWLGGDHVEQLAAFCGDRCESFYRQVASVDGRDRAVFFAEKTWPDPRLLAVLHELYPDLKVVLLVRDFRDMACSIAAFNAKRGYASFGRELTQTDEEHIRGLRCGALRMLEAWHRGSKNMHLVRYEDLIESPQPTLMSLLGALEIEATPDVVQKMTVHATQQAPDVQKAHQTSCDPDASVGRWVNDLAPSLHKVCEESFGDVLDAFGYGPNANGRTDPPPVSFAQRLAQFLRSTVPAEAKMSVVANDEQQDTEHAELDLLRFSGNGQGSAGTQHPLDVARPEACISEMCNRGVTYIVFPRPARDWLNHHAEFRAHLENAAECVAERHDVALVYKLK